MKTRSAAMFAFLIVALLLISSCGKTDNQVTEKPKDEKKEIDNPFDKTKENQEVKSQKVPIAFDDGSSSDGKQKMIKPDPNEVNKTVAMVKLPTVQCEICKKNLTKALKKVDGVETFNIDIENKAVKVKFDKTKADVTKIENAITAAGYDANDKKADAKAYNKLDDCCKLPQDRK